jgi:branched-chain amino acid transport system permease protein
MNELKKSILVSLWFMFLTFPIMVIRVNTIEKTVIWRWENMALIGIGSFVLSFVWRWAIRRKEAGRRRGGIRVRRRAENWRNWPTIPP